MDSIHVDYILPRYAAAVSFSGLVVEALSASALAVSGTTLAAGTSAGAAYVAGGLNVAGNLIVQNTVAASGTASGAELVLGGANVAKNLIVRDTASAAGTNAGAAYVVGGVNVGANLVVQGTTAAAGTTVGGELLLGGLNVTKNVVVQATTAAAGTNAGAAYVVGGVNMGANLIVQDTTAAAGTTVGSAVLSGGLNVTKNVIVQDTTAAAGTTVGSAVLSGGINVTKNLIVQDTTAAAGTTVGSAVLSGGVNVTKNLIVQDTAAAAGTTVGSAVLSGGLNVTKNLIVQDTTAASGTSAGASYVAGGLNVASNVLVQATTDSTTTTTGSAVVKGGIGAAGGVNCLGDTAGASFVPTAAFIAGFGGSVNADKFVNVTAPTNVNGCAITSGKLNLTGDLNKCLHWAGELTTVGDVGTVTLRYTPAYTGVHAGATEFIFTTDTNYIYIAHMITTGDLVARIFDGATTQTITLAAWLPTGGQEYVIEYAFNGLGTSYLYIDGVCVGQDSTVVARGTPVSSKIAVGADITSGAVGAVTNNFSIRDVYVYPTQLYTSAATHNVQSTYSASSYGPVRVTSVLDSYSSTSGCAVFSGGVGVAKELYVSGIGSMSTLTLTSHTYNATLETVYSGTLGPASYAGAWADTHTQTLLVGVVGPCVTIRATDSMALATVATAASAVFAATLPAYARPSGTAGGVRALIPITHNTDAGTAAMLAIDTNGAISIGAAGTVLWSATGDTVTLQPWTVAYSV